MLLNSLLEIYAIKDDCGIVEKDFVFFNREGIYLML